MASGFDDILPYLASAYRRGVLVPFTGSGMSRPACTGWLDFLRGLAREAGVEVSAHLAAAKSSDKLDSAELYRLADKAVLGLASLDVAERAEAYRRALNEGGKPAGVCDIPKQMEALARCGEPRGICKCFVDRHLPTSAGRASWGIPEVFSRIPREAPGPPICQGC